MPGDDALCSSAALINSEYRAKFAGNFAMGRRSGGRGFKSLLLHTPVSRVADIAENRSKSARVRREFRSWADPESAFFAAIYCESANFSHSAIGLGPRIIAIHSPAIHAPDRSLAVGRRTCNSAAVWYEGSSR